MEDLRIRYCYIFPDDSRKNFDIAINPRTLRIKSVTDAEPPSWTNLEFFQCRNCPLSPSEQPNCPLAVSLVDIVDGFNDFSSYEEVKLEVITSERTVIQPTTVQRGLSSLLGLVMATSGCPHTAFFKPMARFHLPFASKEETIYRATSMYLLAQYFLDIKSRRIDSGLDGLKKIYENVQLVNQAIVKRLRSASRVDSSINAVIILDAFAQAIPYEIEDSLEAIRFLFSAYLPGGEDTV